MKYRPNFTNYTITYTAMVVAFLCEKTIVSFFYGNQPLILTTHDLVTHLLFSIGFFAAGFYMSRRNKE